MNKIILLILCTHFAKSCGQCENNKNYKHYHTLIQHERDNIKKVFDGILEKYGDVNKILEELINRLNKAINKGDSGLSQLEKYNNDIRNNNDDSNSKLKPLFNSLKDIEDGLKSIQFNKMWSDEREDAGKSVNKAVLRPAAADIPKHEKELAKWQKFLDELNDTNYAKNVTNLPHSVSRELDLLETLIEGTDSSCFDKFHNDLKLLFPELANLFDLDSSKDEINNIKAKASQNKQSAADVHSDTEKFLQKEKELEDIYDLTKETLALAEELDKLKKSLNDKSGRNEVIMNEKLNKLQEEHEAEVEKLNKKYDVAKGQRLFNEMIRIKQQIEHVNIADVEQDIDNYIREVAYYTCVIEKCKKGVAAIASCKR